MLSFSRKTLLADGHNADSNGKGMMTSNEKHNAWNCWNKQ
jgi:hypothetical protein